MTVDYPDNSDVVMIFVIEDYESFYRSPLMNGRYMLVDRSLLEREWIDVVDLLFWWQRTTLDDGNYTESPIIGSHLEATGALLEIIHYLKDNEPPFSSLVPYVPYTPAPIPLPSASSGSGIAVYQTLTAANRWRAVTVDYVSESPLVQIFIITDYEAFYRDPLANGYYKLVDQDVLQRNWIDRADLIFTWQRTVYEDNTTAEAPVVGSHIEATGVLLEIIHYLKENEP